MSPMNAKKMNSQPIRLNPVGRPEQRRPSAASTAGTGSRGAAGSCSARRPCSIGRHRSATSRAAMNRGQDEPEDGDHAVHRNPPSRRLRQACSVSSMGHADRRLTTGHSGPDGPGIIGRMTERGLPSMDGAPACPFVAFGDDRDGRSTSPDHRHRCFAESPPAPRALAHQEAYCLSSAFPVCPAFQDWARREAAHARGGGDRPETAPTAVPIGCRRPCAGVEAAGDRSPRSGATQPHRAGPGADRRRVRVSPSAATRRATGRRRRRGRPAPARGSAARRSAGARPMSRASSSPRGRSRARVSPAVPRTAWPGAIRSTGSQGGDSGPARRRPRSGRAALAGAAAASGGAGGTGGRASGGWSASAAGSSATAPHDDLAGLVAAGAAAGAAARRSRRASRRRTAIRRRR